MKMYVGFKKKKTVQEHNGKTISNIFQRLKGDKH